MKNINENLSEEQLMSMILEKTKNMTDKDLSLLELKVTSKLVSNQELENHGFLSCAEIILSKPFFNWSEDYNIQLDEMVKELRELFYVSESHWKTSDEQIQLVKVVNTKFLQINPNHIISCESIHPTKAISKENSHGGAILPFEDVESRNIKKFPYNLKTITLIDGRKINVVMLGGVQ